jgi:hypothetical protein
MILHNRDVDNDDHEIGFAALCHKYLISCAFNSGLYLHQNAQFSRDKLLSIA